MMRTAIFGLALISLCPCLATSQGSGPATANGDCSIAISGNNNLIPVATIQASRCGLAKEQMNKIIKLLNTILSNKDANQINTKLDELILIADKPANNQTCVGSNCVQNGSLTNYDNRQFGAPQPPPVVTITKIEELSPLQPSEASHEGDLKQNPGTVVTFTIDRVFSTPIFVVFCDRPCQATDAALLDGASAPKPLQTSNPSITGISLGAMSPVLPGESMTVNIRSMDKNPIKVLGIQGYVPPIGQ